MIKTGLTNFKKETEEMAEDEKKWRARQDSKYCWKDSWV